MVGAWELAGVDSTNYIHTKFVCSIPRRCCTARQALQEKCKSWGSNAEDHWWGWAQTNDAETSSNMGRFAKKHELHQTKKGASACRKFWKKLTARGWKLIWPWTRVLATELQRKASISCATVCCRFACCAQYILDINAVSVHNLFQHFPPPEPTTIRLFVLRCIHKCLSKCERSWPAS